MNSCSEKVNLVAFGFQEELQVVEQCIEDIDGSLEVVIIDSIYGVDLWQPEFLSQYDCVIVAIKDRKCAKDVCHILSTITKKCIMDFFGCLDKTTPYMDIDSVMKYNEVVCSETEYDGAILGISHAEVGIIPRFLDGNWCNLAVSSQDLYYNLKSFERCICEYPHKFKGLKYLIIDMYDYIYFNYDTSRSGMMLPYCSNGGFVEDSHNFEKNKQFDINYDEFIYGLKVMNEKYADEGTVELFRGLFGDVHLKTDYRYFSIKKTDSGKMENRLHIVTDEEKRRIVIDSGLIRNIFEDTIEENKKIFEQIIKTAKEINKDIKIYTIIMPRMASYLEEYMPIVSDWKVRFEQIISDMQELYEFSFIDFSHDEITKRREMFYDNTHLNYYGAMVFTKKLNGIIGNGE